jgi:hypothetical protein
MTSFVKHTAVLVAALMATTALGDKTDDTKSSKTDTKDAGTKKAKKSKTPKTTDDTDSSKKPLEIPVPMGHDSKGLHIPYFDGTGKRQMDFTIGVASRIDEKHVRMTDMQVDTYNDEGKRDLKIDLPTSVYNSETSSITTNYHVKIAREDFVLFGESMIFYTITKQGGLGGGVRMLIYNLKDETDADVSNANANANANTKSNGDKADKGNKPQEAVPSTPQDVDPKMKPDGFKTPPSRAGTGSSDTKPDKLTPLRP